MRIGSSSGIAREARREAWFDHAWSSGHLECGATGWDRIGIDLDDDAVLMLRQSINGSPRRFSADAAASIGP